MPVPWREGRPREGKGGSYYQYDRWLWMNKGGANLNDSQKVGSSLIFLFYGIFKHSTCVMGQHCENLLYLKVPFLLCLFESFEMESTVMQYIHCCKKLSLYMQRLFILGCSVKCRQEKYSLSGNKTNLLKVHKRENFLGLWFWNSYFIVVSYA